MGIALTLLRDVHWRGRPVAGDRPQALLAALAAHDGRPVRPDELIELVWGDEPPSNGMKSLQVLVSRARNACGQDVIVLDGVGYRLGAAPGEVDSGRLSTLVRDAAAALDRDASAAAGLARDALALTADLPGTVDTGDGPLAEIRRAAAADADAARLILARASSRTGAHAAAFPVLAAAYGRRPHDESLLADLLHSEAAVAGPAAALARYESYRRDVRDRVGADPGEELQRAYRGLLALDRPVRHGVRYDGTELIGRGDDLARLRGLLASARVVSIVGPGGLGKTRLAHALARDDARPAVDVVELVGVTAAEDVAVEVGSVLGVRDSASSRRVLTAEQRADIRARIAQRLGQAPSLLILDNCEHLIEAVADLVAFLIAATPDLRVLVTSRAPLAIAAERVYLLGELEPGDGAELFRERATAARPSVRLDERSVARIVGRLDGLPLAIELAAAKVRVMALEEIDRRLENRFALLRGGDRSAPDRHQTLLAVIEWSWNLLAEAEQCALRWLALFRDGFTLEAAETVLGPGALDTVPGLVDQSLLSVRETVPLTPAGVRYRMLETVREFGRMKLAEAGEDGPARAALRGWAVGYAQAQQARLNGTGQFEAIDALGAEETNLADELRAALADGDRGTLVQILAPLGIFWTMRGEHARVMALADGVADAVRGWRPPPELADDARTALAITLNNSLMIGGRASSQLLDLLRELGPDSGRDVYLAGLLRVLLAYDPADAAGFHPRLERLASEDDSRTAAAASQWLSHERENVGDLRGAIEAAQRMLDLVVKQEKEDGPWPPAMARAALAQLSLQAGDHAAAAGHARAAVPVMRRLGARDDEIELRAVLVFCAIADGRLADARAEYDRMELVPQSLVAFGAPMQRWVCRAELALAAGDVAAGLHSYRECANQMRELVFPGLPKTGTEPWSLFGEAIALAAHARYATGDDEAHGRELFLACRADALSLLATERPHLDYPAVGVVLFALGTWSLRHQPELAEDALRLLALAERLAYNRTAPTTHWAVAAAAAERAAPGRLTRLLAEYADRRPADLLAEARRAAERLLVG